MVDAPGSTICPSPAQCILLTVSKPRWHRFRILVLSYGRPDENSVFPAPCISHLQCWLLANMLSRQLGLQVFQHSTWRAWMDGCMHACMPNIKVFMAPGFRAAQWPFVRQSPHPALQQSLGPLVPHVTSPCSRAHSSCIALQLQCIICFCRFLNDGITCIL